MKTTVDDLSKTIMNTLEEYVGAIDANVEKAIKLTSKEAVHELKAADPPGSGRYGSWKDYNKGWKVMYKTTDKRAHRGATIHNDTHYQLAHLLEFGHAMPNGGRSKAYVHISPIAEKAEKEFLRRLKEDL